MKVLFLTERGYLPQMVGGSEWSTHFLCAGLQAAGDEAAVICHLQNQGWIAFRNRIERKLFHRKFPSDRSLGYLVFRGWSVEQGLDEVLSRMKPDVLIVIGAAPNPARLALHAKSTGLPVAYQVRDILFDKHGKDFGKLDGIMFISNSDFTAAELKQSFGYDSHVILPPVDVSHCQVKQPGNRVLLINPDPIKGGEIVIAMAEQRPHIPFVIQESWTSNAQLHSLRARAKAIGNVEWRKPVMDIRTAFKDARILLAPSQCGESWGRVATEAHFSGIPVIGSDIGGLTQAIGSGGIRLPHDAPVEHWLQALDQLWDDDQTWQHYSGLALDYSKRPEINPEIQVEKLQSLLRTLIASNSR